jgi:hypothetical protein
MFLFSRTAWDLIHLWSSVLFISSFILHFAIHWGWVTKVTRKMFQNNRRKLDQTNEPVVLVNQL